MKIEIVYQNNFFLVVNKPAGLVVHPGAGERVETLVDWLEESYPEIKNFTWPDPERMGIVHRLDKDTSGLIILAKSPEALEKLQALFGSHKIKKSYQALVFGKLEKDEGEISGFVGRDPHHRRQQLSRSIHFDFEPGRVRESKTYYRVLNRYQYENYDLTLLEATLETGRMHQIRVHFKAIGCPLIGDPLYNIKHSRKVSKMLEAARQFLHAYKISFLSPFDEEKIELEIPLPDDLEAVLAKLS